MYAEICVTTISGNFPHIEGEEISIRLGKRYAVYVGLKITRVIANFIASFSFLRHLFNYFFQKNLNYYFTTYLFTTLENK